MRNGVDGGKVYVNHRGGIVGAWYAVVGIGGMHAVVRSLSGEIIGMTGVYSNSGWLVYESGAALLLRQVLSERVTTAGNFDQGKHDKHSDDNSKDYGEGFLGHGGLAEGLMMSNISPRVHLAHMPFVTMTP